MIIETENVKFNYETSRCITQDLTFKSAEKSFDECGTEFSPQKYKALGITSQTGDMFTNLAELFSDQCRHTIKIPDLGWICKKRG